MTTFFTKDHEWISVDGAIGTVGITEFAQEQLGDIVYVELPATGKSVAQGAEIAVVESVKAASEIYAPVSGKVVEVNSALEGEPSLVNSAPTGNGWFLKLEIGNASELDGLMDEAAYKSFVDGLDH